MYDNRLVVAFILGRSAIGTIVFWLVVPMIFLDEIYERRLSGALLIEIDPWRVDYSRWFIANVMSTTVTLNLLWA